MIKTPAGNNIEQLRKHEIPGRLAISNGNGGLPKIIVTTNDNTAEIYLHGAHVTRFRKNSEPPLLFVSAKSFFDEADIPFAAACRLSFRGSVRAKDQRCTALRA